MRKFKLLLLAAVAAALLFSAFGCSLLDPIIPENIDYRENGLPDGYEKIEAAEFDYFTAEFGLDKEHVFQTLSFEGLYGLLTAADAETGDYLILLGARNSALTKGAVPLIDEIAWERGIETVYYFDLYLDGG